MAAVASSRVVKVTFDDFAEGSTDFDRFDTFEEIEVEAEAFTTSLSVFDGKVDGILAVELMGLGSTVATLL